MEESSNITGWDVRPYRAGDEGQLVDLFSHVFDEEASVESWLWKLKGRASPIENVWVAVTQGEGKERVIAQYAGIPVRLKFGDSLRDVMLSVESMAASGFRSTGILTKMGAIAYEAWARAGVAAVLGVPNQQVGLDTSSPGWVKLFPLPWLRMPLRRDVMVGGSRRVPGVLMTPAKGLGALISRISHARWQRKTERSEGVSIEEVTSTAMTLAFDALWSGLSGRYRNLVVRDGEWVRWRYLESAGHQYRLLLARAGGEPAGYLAYRVDASPGRPTGYMADLFAAPDASRAARALLGTALDDLWRRKVGSVMATALPRSSLDRLLREVGFKPMRDALNIELVPLDPSLDVAALSKHASWHLTNGDFEVV